MDELKQRMLSQAIVGEGDMIRVDMFLNHCMDMDLMERLGSALAKRFKGEKITKVLTAESSGIALAWSTPPKSTPFPRKNPSPCVSPSRT